MKKKKVLAHVHSFPVEKPKLNQGVKQGVQSVACYTQSSFFYIHWVYFMLQVVGKPPLPPNRTASRQNSTVSSTETETESEEASSNNNDKSESEPSEKEQTTKSAATAAATTTQQKSTGEQNYTQPTHIMKYREMSCLFHSCAI